MPTPYGLNVAESCLRCKLRQGERFCNLDVPALKELDRAKSAIAHPSGSVLFMEGQEARGIFILCQGRVKLSVCSAEGKTLILGITEAGEVLGLSATVSGRPYEVTAEALEPCQFSFVRREEVNRWLHQYGDVCLRAAEQLSARYNDVCHEIRSLGLGHSAAERLAGFLVEEASKNGEVAKPQPRIKLLLTHEEIAQMIGTSRETVTRLLAGFKRRHLIELKGATLLIKNMDGLSAQH